MEKFGKAGKDRITGFTGIITSKHIYMYGCTQYGLNPPVDKEGKTQKIEYFDEGRIEILSEEVSPDSVKGEKNGCDFREHPDR